MRSKPLLALSVFSLVVAPLVIACGVVSEDDVESSEDAIGERELAVKALQIVGGKVEGKQEQCNRCHDINQATLKKWMDDNKKTVDFLSDESKSQDARINYMRRDPTDPSSTFAPAKLGFLSAGTHFGGSATLDKTKTPTAYKHGEMLKKLFKGKDAIYKQFREQTLMPIEAEYDRLTAQEYDTIASWLEKGMPKLDELLREEPRPTSCTDDFAGLRAHASQMKTKGWEAKNKEDGVLMFACPSGGNGLECFNQQNGGKDIFPVAETKEYGKGWAQDGSKIRVMRELGYRTYFWTRTSADGRFVANGQSGGGEDGAIIADLGASLDPAGPKTRDIGASARYDPDFWPDNKGFMFQGTPNGGVFCAQSLLTNLSTTKVSFGEAQCSKLDSVGLYQTVGQKIGDNSIADHFLVNGKYASDNPGQTASDHDLSTTFGPDAKAIVRVMFAKGNDAEAGYEVKQSTEIDTPFLGDIMMSRSGTMLTGRVAGETEQLGYSSRELKSTFSGTQYRFELKPIGSICMKGNKANWSFDERFLTTHHYLERKDFDSDSAWNAYKDKGGADIWVADVVTGKKQRITRMKPGQFALFPHFRSDGWLYFIVRDASAEDKKEYIVASDWALRQREASPTP